ncbi:hypothetical protein E2C01_095260 [Portunus trituberculatus]|uniref:Uncharacterized protein n=1 Tax=Portunus trituberculatus TaxID=210409 RepID=A0A5B7JPD1_PORTR|nr:hypothetical protein [Portunus trituberculatus]
MAVEAIRSCCWMGRMPIVLGCWALSSMLERR